MMVLKHSTVCVILDIRLEVQINQNINEIQMLSSVNTQFIGAVISWLRSNVSKYAFTNEALWSRRVARYSPDVSNKRRCLAYTPSKIASSSFSYFSVKLFSTCDIISVKIISMWFWCEGPICEAVCWVSFPTRQTLLVSGSRSGHQPRVAVFDKFGFKIQQSTILQTGPLNIFFSLNIDVYCSWQVNCQLK